MLQTIKASWKIIAATAAITVVLDRGVPALYRLISAKLAERSNSHVG